MDIQIVSYRRNEKFLSRTLRRILGLVNSWIVQSCNIHICWLIIARLNTFSVFGFYCLVSLCDILLCLSFVNHFVRSVIDRAIKSKPLMFFSCNSCCNFHSESLHILLCGCSIRRWLLDWWRQLWHFSCNYQLRLFQIRWLILHTFFRAIFKFKI